MILEDSVQKDVKEVGFEGGNWTDSEFLSMTDYGGSGHLFVLYDSILLDSYILSGFEVLRRDDNLRNVVYFVQSLNNVQVEYRGDLVLKCPSVTPIVTKGYLDL
jgi:hypothetical protein